MVPVDHTLRAPAGHRAVAAITSPVLGYFVARLVLHWTGLPARLTYAGCLAIALVLAWRAWSARVDLGPDRLRIVNTLASTSLPRARVRRVNDRGRVESHNPGSRALRLPAEALRRLWWVLGAARDYELNRERVRSWLRVLPPADRNARGGFTPDAPAD